jgi:hypothetical protein
MATAGRGARADGPTPYTYIYIYIYNTSLHFHHKCDKHINSALSILTALKRKYTKSIHLTDPKI